MMKFIELNQDPLSLAFILQGNGLNGVAKKDDYAPASFGGGKDYQMY